MRLKLAFLGIGLVINQSANACSFDSTDRWYEKDKSNVFFIVSVSKENDIALVLKRTQLENVSSNDFQIAMVVGEKRIDIDEGRMEDVYFTDGRNIIYNGEIVKNASEFLLVDTATFRQQSDHIDRYADESRYAADRNYIYYEGARRDDNIESKKIDLERIKSLGAGYVTDAKNIYHRGRYIGKLDNYKIIRKELANCFFNRDYQIISIGNKIIIDGYFLENIDPETFEVKAWDYYKKILHYTDKNGEFIAQFDEEQDKYSIEEK